ncbi:MAG TPA: hypothetical protein DCW96_01805 [Stenotrophomonas sp.]|nr:hypothetical protein [Stenotrophomonas sp.]
MVRCTACHGPALAGVVTAVRWLRATSKTTGANAGNCRCPADRRGGHCVLKACPPPLRSGDTCDDARAPRCPAPSLRRCRRKCCRGAGSARHRAGPFRDAGPQWRRQGQSR